MRAKAKSIIIRRKHELMWKRKTHNLINNQQLINSVVLNTCKHWWQSMAAESISSNRKDMSFRKQAFSCVPTTIQNTVNLFSAWQWIPFPSHHTSSSYLNPHFIRPCTSSFHTCANFIAIVKRFQQSLIAAFGRRKQLMERPRFLEAGHETCRSSVVC